MVVVYVDMFIVGWIGEDDVDQWFVFGIDWWFDFLCFDLFEWDFEMYIGVYQVFVSQFYYVVGDVVVEQCGCGWNWIGFEIVFDGELGIGIEVVEFFEGEVVVCIWWYVGDDLCCFGQDGVGIVYGVEQWYVWFLVGGVQQVCSEVFVQWCVIGFFVLVVFEECFV